MKPKIILLVFALAISGLLTSCWSKRELNELAIVSALGIDSSPEGYTLTVQVINPMLIAQQSGGSQAPVTIYTAPGKTLFEALRRLSSVSPRKVYMSHLRIVVIGEELAKRGIGKVLDFLLRDHEMRADFFMLVAREERAERVLEVLTPIEQIPGNMVYQTLDTAETAWGPLTAVDLHELATHLVAEGENPVLTGIMLERSPGTGMGTENTEKADVPAALKMNYLAAFKGDRLAGWLDETESRGYNLIMDYTKSSAVTIPSGGGGSITMEITSQETRVKAVLDNGRPTIEIETKLRANVADAECDITVTAEEVQQRFEKSLEGKMKGYMEAAVAKARQELKSDIFGFGDAVYRANPKVWKDLRESWDREFLNLPVNITVKAELTGLGTITEAFEARIKEQEHD